MRRSVLTCVKNFRATRSNMLSRSAPSSLVSSMTVRMSPFVAVAEAQIDLGSHQQQQQKRYQSVQVALNELPSTLPRNNDAEKDAKVLFDKVIDELMKEQGTQLLKFPKEIIFLLGAPGSGKGTMTDYIQTSRGLTASPVVVSSILQGTEFQEIKAKGGLVSDGIVLRYLFKELLKEENETGVIVDGFPRTEVQARVLSLLWDWMEDQRDKHGREFRRPKFRITVLYIPEEISVFRQLARGKWAIENNERVRLTGVGQLVEVRPSDLAEEVAKARYMYFKDNIWSSVKLLRPKFNYNFIDASGPKDQVAENLKNEMKYQSSLELSKEAFDMITLFPTASNLTRHARQSLVKRLDSYASEHYELFEKVLTIMKTEFLKFMERQALTGTAIVRSQNPILNEKLAVDMILDVLLERGYNVVLDQERDFRPLRVNLETGEIIGTTLKIWHFTISHEPPRIRS